MFFLLSKARLAISLSTRTLQILLLSNPFDAQFRIAYLAAPKYPLYATVTVLSIKSCAAHLTGVDVEAVLNCFDPIIDISSFIKPTLHSASRLCTGAHLAYLDPL